MGDGLHRCCGHGKHNNVMYEYPLILNQGLDISDIELVIQWRYVSSLCTLMQRLGRGGRGHGKEAIGLYLVEPSYFDDPNLKRGRGTADEGNRERPSKRRKPMASKLDSNVPDEIQDASMAAISEISAPAEQAEIGPNNSLPKTVVTDPAAIPNFPSLNSQASAEYEDEVMRLYINSKQCDVCRRAVSNRYFGNHLVGKSRW